MQGIGGRPALVLLSQVVNRLACFFAAWRAAL